MRAAVRVDELVRDVPRLLKVSSGDQIGYLIRQGLRGITLRHSPSPPRSLPIKMDYQYFSLERSGPAWEAIKLSHNLAAYVPAELPDPQLELVILLPSRER